MGAALAKCFGSVVDDPAKMSMIISKSFGFFDKDKSGFIEAAEAGDCCQKVLNMAKITNVTPAMLEGTFDKVAGADKKLDQAEFTTLVNEVLGKVGVKPVPVPAAAAAAPAAAPAAAAPAPAAAAAAAPQ